MLTALTVCINPIDAWDCSNMPTHMQTGACALAGSTICQSPSNHLPDLTTNKFTDDGWCSLQHTHPAAGCVWYLLHILQGKQGSQHQASLLSSKTDTSLGAFAEHPTNAVCSQTGAHRQQSTGSVRHAGISVMQGLDQRTTPALNETQCTRCEDLQAAFKQSMHTPAWIQLLLHVVDATATQQLLGMQHSSTDTQSSNALALQHQDSAIQSAVRHAHAHRSLVHRCTYWPKGLPQFSGQKLTLALLTTANASVL